MCTQTLLTLSSTLARSELHKAVWTKQHSTCAAHATSGHSF